MDHQCAINKVYHLPTTSTTLDCDKQFICAACEGRFATICELHCHITIHNDTGAYQFDPVLSVAYPKYETTCSYMQTIEELTGYWNSTVFLRKAMATKLMISSAVDTGTNMAELKSDDTTNVFKKEDNSDKRNQNDSDSLVRDNKDIHEKLDLDIDADIGGNEDCDDFEASDSVCADIGDHEDDDIGTCNGFVVDKEKKDDTATPSVKRKRGRPPGNQPARNRKRMKGRELRLLVGRINASDYIMNARKEHDTMDEGSFWGASGNTWDSEMSPRRSARKIQGQTTNLTKLFEYSEESDVEEGKKELTMPLKIEEETIDMEYYKELNRKQHVLRQNRKKKREQNYFHGKLMFNDMKIERPEAGVWDKGGSVSNESVKVTETCDLPAEWTLREQGVSENRFEKPTPKIFICETCGKAFKGKETLRGHINQHLGIKPYICEICGKTYAQKGSLESHRHSSAHTNIEDFIECKDCGKRLANQTTFKAHMILQHLPNHNQYNFSCQLCNKRFPNRKYLDTHMNMHSDVDSEERKFACKLCDKTYKRQKYLTQHMKEHNTVFQCKTCTRQFASHSSLCRHEKIHQARTDHVCHICSHKFVQKSPYWTHMEKHHDLTKQQLMVLFPDKHLHKSLRHTWKDIAEKAQIKVEVPQGAKESSLNELVNEPVNEPEDDMVQSAV